MSKLDHVRPALHKLSDEGLDVSVRLVPLQKHHESRVEIFCNFIRSQKSYGKLPGKHTVELISTDKQFSLSDNWYSNWSNFLNSLIPKKRKLVGENGGIIILLSDDQIPNGITLASSRLTLIIPGLRLIEFPVGYDLNSQGDNFDPSRQIKEQMIEYETWTGEGIRKPLIEISKREKILKTFQIIRGISETNALLSKENEFNNLTSEKITRIEIWNGIKNIELSQEKSRKTSTSSLTNYLRILRDNSVIERIDGTPAYRITEIGLIVSGLLSHANK
jgi:hypothetical protein